MSPNWKTVQAVFYDAGLGCIMHSLLCLEDSSPLYKMNNKTVSFNKQQKGTDIWVMFVLYNAHISLPQFIGCCYSINDHSDLGAFSRFSDLRCGFLRTEEETLL